MASSNPKYEQPLVREPRLIKIGRTYEVSINIRILVETKVYIIRAEIRKGVPACPRRV
jgi:hypothetical protein